MLDESEICHWGCHRICLAITTRMQMLGACRFGDLSIEEPAQLLVCKEQMTSALGAAVIQIQNSKAATESTQILNILLKERNNCCAHADSGESAE